jgi:hypothetical protein
MEFRSPRADAVIATLLAAALVVAMLLWLYYPAIPRGIFGWALLFVIGVPTWFLLEWLGGRIIGAQFFSQMGRAARIALAVPVLILFLVVAAYIVHLGQRAIAGS